MAEALTVIRTAGGDVRMQLPVPDEAFIVLPALVDVSLREWVIVEDDDTITVCDHRFVVVRWDATEPPAGLVLRHLCCR